MMKNNNNNEEEEETKTVGLLTVNRNSWHYALATFTGQEYNVPNLCSYFWNVVFSMFIIAIMVFFGCMLAWFATHALISPFITYYVSWSLGTPLCTSWLGWMTGSPASSVILTHWHHTVSYLVWGLVAFLGYQFWLDTPAGEKWKSSREAKPDMTFVRVTKEFAKARKERFCPTINFVD